MILRWSLSDKKRLEKSLNEFLALKNDIHEYIKFLCLGSDLGINTAQHLKRLQEDQSSIELGINNAARLQSLQLTKIATQPEQTSFELPDSWNQSLRAEIPIEEHSGRKYLQERRQCSFDSEGRVDRRTKSRVDGLAQLLNQPKDIGFCIPRCIGWSQFPARQSVAFVFEIPNRAIIEPISLFKLMDAKNVQPDLEERFKLAHALANCISQLQLVKWVHESFRSDNILFFPRNLEREAEEYESASEINFGQPFVLGFEFSRPEFGLNWSESPGDDCVETNVYRHPERQGTPMVSFSKIHDIYALGKTVEPATALVEGRLLTLEPGVVLLEIGLWKQAITLQKDRFQYCRNPEVIREQLIKHATRKLAGKMGSKYQQVVLKCLTADFGVRNDTKEDLKLQQAFRLQVVDVLEKTANSV
ncbi:hypothetical protein DIS24_g857 [Lasiodiplodia hormozganensis]|uniref:Protein kinase domain-containing protein n=1 Tax=Lasiodiplodia hormozganensis TaxID=869390 RepID=A0AA40D5F7_9PEZI|nr:hypothetical protein DIS24_g857 [Lasiodiplodia hormozganensis]